MTSTAAWGQCTACGACFDAYRDWRKGGAPDGAAIERAGEKYYAQLVEPELRKAPIV